MRIADNICVKMCVKSAIIEQNIREMGINIREIDARKHVYRLKMGVDEPK